MERIFCTVCKNPIPEEKDRRKAVVCSDECKQKLNDHRRHRKDLKICRTCSKPSTPEERVLFARWRRETFPQPKRGRPKNKPEDAPAEATPEPVAEGGAHD